MSNEKKIINCCLLAGAAPKNVCLWSFGGGSPFISRANEGKRFFLLSEERKMKSYDEKREGNWISSFVIGKRKGWRWRVIWSLFANEEHLWWFPIRLQQCRSLLLFLTYPSLVPTNASGRRSGAIFQRGPFPSPLHSLPLLAKFSKCSHSSIDPSWLTCALQSRFRQYFPPIF